MFLPNLIIFFLSLIAIWYGAGLIIKAVDLGAQRLKIQPFVVAFCILGLMTSIPEFAVGLTSISQNNPGIYVGNLIGGIPVLFLFVIPILAIAGRGIVIKNQMRSENFLLAIAVILLPSIFLIDRNLSIFESWILVIAYIILIISIQIRHGFLNGHNGFLFKKESYSPRHFAELIIGGGIVYLSSQLIVEKTQYFSEILGLSPFIIALILLSLGTNLPELSLAIRSVASGKKNDVAFGDYLGSAAANSFLIGALTLYNGASVQPGESFISTFIFIFVGVSLFYYFAKTDKKITRTEGLILLGLYAIYVIVELGKF